MKLRTKMLLGLTLTLTALVAWSAFGPYPYLGGAGDLVVPPYPWNLPVLSLAYGLTVTALLSFTKSSFRFFGSVISSCVGGSLVFLLLLSATHSSQLGYAQLFFILLGWTVGLLIYSGYTLAMWLGDRKSELAGDAE